jgi:hypothetical protein
MRIVDTDPNVLRLSADAALHAFEQTINHVDAEIVGAIPPLLETLTPEGPYGYTILPEVNPDGSINLPIATTREEIKAAYEMIRGASDLLSVQCLVEVRGAWYTFQENISRARPKATGEIHSVPTVGLFPSGSGKGITGELVWFWMPRSGLGKGSKVTDAGEDPWRFRLDLLEAHDRYLEALRAGDVEGMLASLTDGAASAIRDYVRDTGTLIGLHGEEEHRSYFRGFFNKYEIRSVDLLHRVVQDWFLFAELRLTVTPRDRRQASTTLAFHTAEFFIIGKDGRFVACIGHGTDPA